MAVVKVLQFEDGSLQVFVDGEDLPFEDAERITKEIFARLNAAVPGGVKMTSAVEGHREGGMRHAHIVQEIRQ